MVVCEPLSVFTSVQILSWTQFRVNCLTCRPNHVNTVARTDTDLSKSIAFGAKVDGLARKGRGIYGRGFH